MRGHSNKVRVRGFTQASRESTWQHVQKGRVKTRTTYSANYVGWPEDDL